MEFNGKLFESRTFHENLFESHTFREKLFESRTVICKAWHLCSILRWSYISTAQCTSRIFKNHETSTK